MNAEEQALEQLRVLASETGLDVIGGKVRRSSSRFCLGVEHGDYNGTELFGVGTDRFIWLAYKTNDSGRVRLASANFPLDEIVDYSPGQVPASDSVADSWGRFPFGVDVILQEAGYSTAQGFDAVLVGNIPGGGMSRSASLALNLILTVMDVNGIDAPDGMDVVALAQKVENDYIGSPCGNLDQIMIYFAKEGMGTHYNPADQSIRYVPYGGSSDDFRIVSLDTGTDRPGLEKSTYKIRREECDAFAELLKASHGIECLGDVRDPGLMKEIETQYGESHPDLVDRLRYLYAAQRNFVHMMTAWECGDIRGVGALFRDDGHNLRDLYKISGPELETMCNLARTVPGVLGERMLGGGDKGASGALVKIDAVEALEQAISRAYPLCYPGLHDKFAVHSCRMVDGIKVLPGL